MKREVFDAAFIEYRDHLVGEAQRVHAFASVFFQVNESKAKHWAAMNEAPAFFQVVDNALFSVVILWIDKLLDEDGERGLFNFLTFIENNRKWLSKDELQRRRGFPDDHWMLADRQLVTTGSIEVDRQSLRNLSGLSSVQIRRDKFHGHFDKRYFFDRAKLDREAPLKLNDVEKILTEIGRVLNAYSVQFDRSTQHWGAMNLRDLDQLLLAVEKGQRARGYP
jgi:hypothetical protein